MYPGPRGLVVSRVVKTDMNRLRLILLEVR
jgi:hypothetical protein